MREIRNENGKQMSLQAIADKLKEDNVKPPGKSSTWFHTTVKRILERGTVITKGKGLKIDDASIKEAEVKDSADKELLRQIKEVDERIGFSIGGKSFLNVYEDIAK